MFDKTDEVHRIDKYIYIYINVNIHVCIRIYIHTILVTGGSSVNFCMLSFLQRNICSLNFEKKIRWRVTGFEKVLLKFVTS